MRFLKRLLSQWSTYLHSSSLEDTFMQILANYDTDTKLSCIKGHFTNKILNQLKSDGFILSFIRRHTREYDKGKISYSVSGITDGHSLCASDLVGVRQPLLVYVDRSRAHPESVSAAVIRTSGEWVIAPDRTRINIKIINSCDLPELVKRLEELEK